MKKILITLGLAAVVSSSQAQGLINFFNSASTLVTLSSNSVTLGSTPTTLGQFRYELFIAPAGTLTPASFVSAGVIGTNQAAAGRFTGGLNAIATGAPAGSTRAIMVRGWSTSLGSTYAQALANYGSELTPGYLGQSAIAPNFIFGGFDGVGTIPTSPAFSGTAISTGFSLVYAPVPEPSSMALAGLGAASLLMFRRRK